MKQEKPPRFGAYGVLALAVSGLLLLGLLAVLFMPVIRQYTVRNATEQALRITPMWQPGGPEDSSEAAAGPYEVLQQYLFFSGPALPAAHPKDILLAPGAAVALYVDYEDLKQEEGRQLLLLQDAAGQYRVLDADFWEQTTIANPATLPRADARLIAAKNAAAGGTRSWVILLLWLGLIVGLPAGRWLAVRRRRARLQASEQPARVGKATR